MSVTGRNVLVCLLYMQCIVVAFIAVADINQWRWTQLHCSACWVGRPVWARGRCRISPPRFLAECCKRQLKQGSLVLLYFRLSAFSDFIEFVYLYFPVLFCLSVSVKWLAVKTASEMTYTVSGGALNFTQTKPPSHHQDSHHYSHNACWEAYLDTA